MVHDPVEQGHNEYNSLPQFIQFQLDIADARGTEILILLLYLAVQLDLRTGIEEAESKVFAMFTVKLKNVYGDSLVLLVQRSCSQTSSWS